MKDALGHGSNAHNRGIDALARPVPVHPNVLRVIQKNPWGASVKPQTGRDPAHRLHGFVAGSHIRHDLGRALWSERRQDHS